MNDILCLYSESSLKCYQNASSHVYHTCFIFCAQCEKILCLFLDSFINKCLNFKSRIFLIYEISNLFVVRIKQYILLCCSTIYSIMRAILKFLCTPPPQKKRIVKFFFTLCPEVFLAAPLWNSRASEGSRIKNYCVTNSAEIMLKFFSDHAVPRFKNVWKREVILLKIRKVHLVWLCFEMKLSQKIAMIFIKELLGNKLGLTWGSSEVLSMAPRELCCI
jgi:hypothetical protein